MTTVRFVARFIGSPAMNVVKGTINGAGFQAAGGFTLPIAGAPAGSSGMPAVYGLRPEAIRLDGAGIEARVHVVEPMPMDGSDPIENYRAIREELVRYDASLGERREIVVMSKAELPGADAVRAAFAAAIGREVLGVSAVTGQGLDMLLRAVVIELDRRRESA